MCESKEQKYLKLAELYQKDFFSRRTLEWKLSLGFWGSSAAFAYFILGNTDIHSSVACYIHANTCFFNRVCIGLLFAQALALLMLQHSNARNRMLYWWFLEQVEGSDTKRPFAVKPNKAQRKKEFCSQVCNWNRWGWFFYHLLISCFVICGVLFLLQNTG